MVGLEVDPYAFTCQTKSSLKSELRASFSGGPEYACFDLHQSLNGLPQLPKQTTLQEKTYQGLFKADRTALL